MDLYVRIRMAKIKILIKFLDYFFGSVLGLTIIELLPMLNLNIFDTVDGALKGFLALAGLLYFLISIPHKFKMQKLERQMKEEELNRIKKQNSLNE